MRLNNIDSADFYHMLDDLSEHSPVYIVGGSVRDLFMGNPRSDVDVAVRLPIENIVGFLAGRQYIKTINQVGIAFGVVKVVLKDETEIDVAQFRSETYVEGSRKPETVTFVQSIEEDLARRDFTINAMALFYTRKDREFVLNDPFNGLGDFHNGIIRAVGNPDERFSEDTLRIQRAVRFAVRFGFAIEPNTLAAMIRMAPLLRA